MRKLICAAALAAASLTLSACERVDDTAAEEGPTTTSQTLSAAIAAADGMTTASGVIGETDLANVFDAAGSYTFLAPTDEAFGALGDDTSPLMSETDAAPMIALLRGHIVTGYLRPEDLRTALADDDDGEVSMATVGSDPVTFRMAGDAIIAIASDGSEVRLLVDRAIEAENGVLIPVDGLLSQLQ